MMSTSMPIETPVQCVMIPNPLSNTALQMEIEIERERERQRAEDNECYRNLLSCWCLCYFLQSTLI